MPAGAAIALGNFDGLHAGHRAVINSARRASVRLKTGFAVATFEPAPRRYFQPDAQPFRLMTPLRRQIELKRLGVDGIHLLRFDTAMAAMTDRDFCEQVIVGEMGAQSVSVGFDFRFGKGRMGDVTALRQHGRDLGFEVDVVTEVTDGSVKVSSSRIREAILLGDMSEAARGLGGPWIIDAVVEHGEKRGRMLGFPTANMNLGELVQPAYGIYAVYARLEQETTWRPAIASFGRTPTTGLRDPLLEVMVLDMTADFYGQRMHTAFIAHLRPEARFESIDALVEQMHRDVSLARTVLSSVPPPRED